MINTNNNLNKKILINKIWKDTLYDAKEIKQSSMITQSSPNDQDKTNPSVLNDFFNKFDTKCELTYKAAKLPQYKYPIARNLRYQFIKVSQNQISQQQKQPKISYHYENNANKFKYFEIPLQMKRLNSNNNLRIIPTSNIGGIVRQRSLKIIKNIPTQGLLKLKCIRNQLNQIYNQRRTPTYYHKDQRQILRKSNSIKF